MKVRTLKIVFESIDKFKERTRWQLQDAVESGARYLRRKDVIRFDSVSTYQRIMSDQKYAILAAISKHEPHSIYRLAEILGRAHQNVSRDCEVLAGHGFIKWDDSGDGRGTKAPRLTFPYEAIEVVMDTVTYKVGFAPGVA